jgi:hypothetical protein
MQIKIKKIYKYIDQRYYQQIFLFYFHQNKLCIYHNLKNSNINHMKKNSFYKYSIIYHSIIYLDMQNWFFYFLM